MITLLTSPVMAGQPAGTAGDPPRVMGCYYNRYTLLHFALHALQGFSPRWKFLFYLLLDYVGLLWSTVVKRRYVSPSHTLPLLSLSLKYLKSLTTVVVVPVENEAKLTLELSINSIAACGKAVENAVERCGK